MNNQRYKTLFILFYLIILVCWGLVVTFRYVYPEVLQDSPVIAEYLINEDVEKVDDVDQTSWLKTVNMIVKINLFIYDSIFGLIFLFLLILPRLKQHNYFLLTVCVVAGYFTPKFLLYYTTFTGGEGYFGSFVTVNELILWLAATPLNWAVFLYFYYLIEAFYIEPRKQETLE